MYRAAVVLLVLAGTRLVGAQYVPQRLSLAPGTYELTLCFPTCSAPGGVIGSGVLVLVADTLELPFEAALVERLRAASRLLVRRREGAPSACFRVTAQRQVAGREYYPGIIPVGLLSMPLSGDPVEIILYQSPDASFVVEVQRAGPDSFVGVGRQNDWDGKSWQAGEVAGQRVGAAAPERCRPPG